MIKKLAFVLVFACFLSGALAEDYPSLDSYVTDQAGIISEQDESVLVQLIGGIEQSTSVEIAILTIESLGGSPIEDYSIHLAEKNKIGKKDKDNGVLILVSRDDREYRIEVGYGLEGEITDVKAMQLAAKILAPYFREERYGEGLAELVKAIGAQVGAVGEEYESASADLQQERSYSWAYNIFIVIFILVMVFSRSRRSRIYMAGSFGTYGGFGSGGFGSSGISFGGGSFGGGGFSGGW